MTTAPEQTRSPADPPTPRNLAVPTAATRPGGRSRGRVRWHC